MPRNPAHAQRRQQELARLLERRPGVSTTWLARHFGVNPMTIRRDLRLLEESGLALRRYGGAVAAHRITFEFAFDRRLQRALEEKRRIGDEAAQRIRRGQTVFLDTGTTTLQVARSLARRAIPCQIATSSLVIASELWGRQHIELMLLGGRVRQGSPDLVGPAIEAMLERLTADLAILGSEGIDPARGSFAGDLEAARVAERMAACARRVIVVADHSKLGLAGPVRYLRINQIDEIITDRGAPRSILTALRARGVTVTTV